MAVKTKNDYGINFENNIHLRGWIAVSVENNSL